MAAKGIVFRPMRDRLQWNVEHYFLLMLTRKIKYERAFLPDQSITTLLEAWDVEFQCCIEGGEGSCTMSVFDQH